MSTVETAAILATHADYMIASEESESGYGWDYKATGDFLAENPKSDGLELGKKVCDSFYQSCEDYGFAASATMSVVDLSKMDTLLKGFDVYSQKLYQAIHNDSGFTDIARNIFSGDQFGSSGRGGSSFNLIDMGQLISSGTEYIDKSNDVLSALEDTVAYKVNGSQHENASGLSIYYPLFINSSDELDIFSDICVSPYYLAFVNDALYKELQITANALEKLLSLYTNDYSGSGYTSDYHYSVSQNEIWNAADDYNNDGDSDLIAYADKPALDTSGHYGFTLTEDALQVTDHVEANIYTWNEEESTLFELGYSGEVNADYTTGKFSDKFDGNWFYLPDGQLLSAYYVDSANGSSTYTAPVMLNGEESNLRFIYNAEDHTATLVDAWNGTDGYGNASRSTELKKGDKIVPIYHPYTKYRSSKKNYTGKEYKLTGEKQLKYQKLNAGEYWYSFDIYDIYGNYKETDPVMFHVKDSGLAFSDETHIWKEATCTEPKTCAICGATEGEAAGHQWKEATCTAPKTCTVCGETEGEALGHDWIEATITAPKTCSRCGETEGEPLALPSVRTEVVYDNSYFCQYADKIELDVDDDGEKELVVRYERNDDSVAFLREIYDVYKNGNRVFTTYSYVDVGESVAGVFRDNETGKVALYKIFVKGTPTYMGNITEEYPSSKMLYVYIPEELLYDDIYTPLIAPNLSNSEIDQINTKSIEELRGKLTKIF